MMKKASKLSQRGFTIIELLIATVVFSVILMLASSAVVQIGRLYYKGITQSKTQEKTRAIADEVSQSIQFGNGTKQNGATATQFCLGDTRYTFNVNRKVTSRANYGLVAKRLGGADISCNNPGYRPDLEGEEMLATNMRLMDFSVVALPVSGASDKAYQIRVKVAYGDNDLLTHYADNAVDTTPPLPSPASKDATCKTGISGSSFCATAQLDTIVKKRLN